MESELVKTVKRINKKPIKKKKQGKWVIKWDSEIIYIKNLITLTHNIHIFILGYSYKNINHIRKNQKLEYAPRLNQIYIGSSIKELILVNKIIINLIEEAYIISDYFSIKIDKTICEILIKIINQAK